MPYLLDLMKTKIRIIPIYAKKCSSEYSIGLDIAMPMLAPVTSNTLSTIQSSPAVAAVRLNGALNFLRKASDTVRSRPETT